MKMTKGMVTAALLLGAGLLMVLSGRGDAAPALADSRLHVEWNAEGAGLGESRIFGYVYNDHREDTVNVRLRIIEVDASGRTVVSTVQPVGATVRAGGRVFFDLRVPEGGARYQVAVESFEFMPDGEWETQVTEQLLLAAGFDKKVADTPEKLAHLETLTPARRIVARPRDGQLYYVYADPAVCKCLYVGTAEDYQRALAERQESEQLQAVQDHSSYYDPAFWSLWAGSSAE
jgi:hypothetical protein